MLYMMHAQYLANTLFSFLSVEDILKLFVLNAFKV